jgi:hypothetical protein
VIGRTVFAWASFSSFTPVQLFFMTGKKMNRRKGEEGV